MFEDIMIRVNMVPLFYVLFYATNLEDPADIHVLAYVAHN